MIRLEGYSGLGSADTEWVRRASKTAVRILSSSLVSLGVGQSSGPRCIRGFQYSGECSGLVIPGISFLLIPVDLFAVQSKTLVLV